MASSMECLGITPKAGLLLVFVGEFDEREELGIKRMGVRKLFEGMYRVGG